MKYDIIEKRIIIPDLVRETCMRRNYCTECTNKQYADLLSICDQDLSIDVKVITIATLIMKYSDRVYAQKIYGMTESEWLGEICHDLYNNCIISLITCKTTT